MRQIYIYTGYSSCLHGRWLTKAFNKTKEGQGGVFFNMEYKDYNQQICPIICAHLAANESEKTWEYVFEMIKATVPVTQFSSIILIQVLFF